jgi:hypothetical protein
MRVACARLPHRTLFPNNRFPFRCVADAHERRHAAAKSTKYYWYGGCSMYGVEGPGSVKMAGAVSECISRGAASGTMPPTHPRRWRRSPLPCAPSPRARFIAERAETHIAHLIERAAPPLRCSMPALPPPPARWVLERGARIGIESASRNDGKRRGEREYSKPQCRNKQFVTAWSTTTLGGHVMPSHWRHNAAGSQRWPSVSRARVRTRIDAVVKSFNGKSAATSTSHICLQRRLNGR